jgi:hypothetical protein
MTYPELYKKGMDYSEYSNMTFIRWFFMALCHSCIIYFVVLMVLEAPDKMMDNGQISGFWVGGHVVYGAAVWMANILILMKFHVHDGYHMIPILMMLSAYYLFLWAESASGEFEDIRYIFTNIFNQWLTWITLAFCTGIVRVQESMYRLYVKYYSVD